MTVPGTSKGLIRSPIASSPWFETLSLLSTRVFATVAWSSEGPSSAAIWEMELTFFRFFSNMLSLDILLRLSLDIKRGCFREGSRSDDADSKVLRYYLLRFINTVKELCDSILLVEALLPNLVM